VNAKRRRSTFRRHLVVTSVVTTAVFAALVGASLFIPLVAQIDRPDLDRQAAGGIAEHILYLHRNFWPVVFGALIASAASGLLLYQRMTGPLIRFVSAFAQISRGERPSKLTLRRFDYLTDEADALNAMVEALGERAAAREAGLARCLELVDDFAASESGTDDRRRILDELREALKGIR
jgi:methyl-accepting chemotaxis protein